MQTKWKQPKTRFSGILRHLA